MTLTEVAENATTSQVAAVIRPEINLNLQAFWVRLTRGLTAEMSVDLYVRDLDPDGFVTDNQPYIDELRRMSHQSIERLAAVAVELAKEKVGDRLTRVIVRAETLKNRRDMVWPEGSKEQLFPNGSNHSSVGFESVFFDAALVDNHVCGGYDGQFRCDLQVATPRQHNVRRGLLIEEIQRQFKIAMLKASCEDLVQGVAQVAIDVAREEALAVKARVYNLTGWAGIYWEKGMQVPPFPRNATRAETKRTKAYSRQRVC